MTLRVGFVYYAKSPALDFCFASFRHGANLMLMLNDAKMSHCSFFSINIVYWHTHMTFNPWRHVYLIIIIEERILSRCY